MTGFQVAQVALTRQTHEPGRDDAAVGGGSYVFLCGHGITGRRDLCAGRVMPYSHSMWIAFIAAVVIVVMLIRIETLIGTVIARINKVEGRFEYDWTGMSAELVISAYKREGGLICRANEHFASLTSAINMPVKDDWLIFEAGGRTYRGVVVGREVRYGEHGSIRFPGDATGTRLHMMIRVDVVCDNEVGWSLADVERLKEERA